MPDTRLKGLYGIRALCALFILWGHMAQKDFVSWEPNSFPIPECCAYVFFVISGFLAGFRIDTISSPISYYKKKAKRILPLYFFYLLIVVIAFSVFGRGVEVLNADFLYYLFLIPSIPFVGTNGILPLVHLWFIGTLVVFYLVFPLFAKVEEENRRNVSLFVVLFWFAIKVLLRVYDGNGYLYRMVSITCFDILFLGVWGGLRLRNGSTFLDDKKKFILGLVSWGLFLLSGLYGRYIPAPIRTEYVSVLSLIMIMSLQISRPMSILENKVTRFLGGISYEVYVSHILIIILLSEFYCHMGWQWSGWMLYPVVTVVVILCAYAINTLLERVLYRLPKESFR